MMLTEISNMNQDGSDETNISFKAPGHISPEASAELKRLAREFLTGNYTTLISALLFSFFVPTVMLSFFSSGGISFHLNLAAVTYSLAAIIIYIIAQLIHISILRIHLLLAKRQPVTYKDMIWVFQNQPDRFILAILLLTAILLLPIIPASICIYYITTYILNTKFIFYFSLLSIFTITVWIELYLYYTYGLIYLLFIEHPDMTLRNTFCTSRSLMLGKKKKFFFLQLGFIGWLFLGFCSFGIGFLWIIPYFTQTSVNFYFDITGYFNKKAEHIDIFVSD